MLAYSSHGTMLPSRQQKGIGTSEMPVSQLNTQPMVSPVNASRQTSRSAAHHSGPERLARPYPAKDFHLLSFASLSWRSRLLAKNGRTGDAADSPAFGTKADAKRLLSDRQSRLKVARLRSESRPSATPIWPSGRDT